MLDNENRMLLRDSDQHLDFLLGVNTASDMHKWLQKIDLTTDFDLDIVSFVNVLFSRFLIPYDSGKPYQPFADVFYQQFRDAFSESMGFEKLLNLLSHPAAQKSISINPFYSQRSLYIFIYNISPLENHKMPKALIPTIDLYDFYQQIQACILNYATYPNGFHQYFQKLVNEVEALQPYSRPERIQDCILDILKPIAAVIKKDESENQTFHDELLEITKRFLPINAEKNYDLDEYITEFLEHENKLHINCYIPTQLLDVIERSKQKFLYYPEFAKKCLSHFEGFNTQILNMLSDSNLNQTQFKMYLDKLNGLLGKDLSQLEPMMVANMLFIAQDNNDFYLNALRNYVLHKELPEATKFKYQLAKVISDDEVLAMQKAINYLECFAKYREKFAAAAEFYTLLKNDLSDFLSRSDTIDDNFCNENHYIFKLADLWLKVLNNPEVNNKNGTTELLKQYKEIKEAKYPTITYFSLYEKKISKSLINHLKVFDAAKCPDIYRKVIDLIQFGRAIRNETLDNNTQHIFQSIYHLSIDDGVEISLALNNLQEQGIHQQSEDLTDLKLALEALKLYEKPKNTNRIRTNKSQRVQDFLANDVLPNSSTRRKITDSIEKLESYSRANPEHFDSEDVMALTLKTKYSVSSFFGSNAKRKTSCARLQEWVNSREETANKLKQIEKKPEKTEKKSEDSMWMQLLHGFMAACSELLSMSRAVVEHQNNNVSKVNTFCRNLFFKDAMFSSDSEPKTIVPKRSTRSI